MPKALSFMGMVLAVARKAALPIKMAGRLKPGNDGGRHRLPTRPCNCRLSV
jgi:hypothetical protein